MKTSLILVVVLMTLAALLWAGSPSAETAPQLNTLPVFSTNGDLLSKPHAVLGSFTVGPQGAMATFTGQAAFTSKDSYQCFISTVAPGPIQTNIIKIDGSKIGMRGSTNPTPWEAAFVCIGN